MRSSSGKNRVFLLTTIVFTIFLLAARLEAYLESQQPKEDACLGQSMSSSFEHFRFLTGGASVLQFPRRCLP
jgi:hypothetical protein